MVADPTERDVLLHRPDSDQLEHRSSDRGHSLPSVHDNGQGGASCV